MLTNRVSGTVYMILPLMLVAQTSPDYPSIFQRSRCDNGIHYATPCPSSSITQRLQHEDNDDLCGRIIIVSWCEAR